MATLGSLATAVASPVSAVVSDASLAGVAEAGSDAAGSSDASSLTLSGAAEPVSPVSEEPPAAESFASAAAAVVSAVPSVACAPSLGIVA